jgi:hypothetical protein
VRDPDAMNVLPTPKPTRKAEALARAPPTIASSCEGNAALKKWHLRLIFVFLFFEKKNHYELAMGADLTVS